MSDDTANAGTLPWRLTEDVETAIGPKLADPFVDHLDGVTSVDFAARAETAATWLARSHPDLHAALHLVTVEGLSHREAGRRLGLTHRTVGKRVDAALVKVRARCMAGETAA
jgi:DNA-directed RNA polymerase specialized sigma24 family protein